METPTPAHPPQKMSRRRFLKLATRGTLATLVVGGSGSAAYAKYIEPGRLRLRQQNIFIASLPGAFDGYRIAHFSDIHMDDWMNGTRLLSIVQHVNALQADVVVITGDFVTGSHGGDDSISQIPAELTQALHEALSQLKSRDGAFAVLGNHDHWTSAEEVSAIVKGAGVRMLTNDALPLQRKGQRLWLCGVDDAFAGAPDLPRVTAALAKRAQPQEVALLLSHSPDYADEVVKTERFALQLSAHSHGGQVALPFIGPPVLPPWGRKYHTGLYRVRSGTSRLWQFTTRGVGMVRPRVRFNCPPEIVLLTLRRANGKAA